MTPDPQWLALSRVDEPFRAHLMTLLPDAPRRFIAPKHFDLSVRDGDLLWVSGQVPRFNEEIRHIGIVGATVSMAQAQEAAQLCLANFLSIVAAACGGDLSKVERIVRITGYVRGGPLFGEQSEVINAASQILVSLFGDRGHHARSAIGVHSLPGGASVEIEGVVRLKASLGD